MPNACLSMWERACFVFLDWKKHEISNVFGAVSMILYGSKPLKKKNQFHTKALGKKSIWNRVIVDRIKL